MNVFIYGIFVKRACLYVGQTVDIQKRRNKHEHSGRFPEGFRLRPLRKVTEEEAAAAEQDTILHFRARGHSLLNAAPACSPSYSGAPTQCPETGEVFRSKAEMVRVRGNRVSAEPCTVTCPCCKEPFETTRGELARLLGALAGGVSTPAKAAAAKANGAKGGRPRKNPLPVPA